MAQSCPQCLADNPAAAKFCRQCGKSISGAAVQSATKPTPLMRQWRSLKRDLTRGEVKKLLGEPLRIDTPHPFHGAQETWTYEYHVAGRADAPVMGVLQFNADEGRLLSWTEPDWKSLGPEAPAA